jgi:hypothetical protein
VTVKFPLTEWLADISRPQDDDGSV